MKQVASCYRCTHKCKIVLLLPCGEAMLGRWGKWLEQPRAAFQSVGEEWAGHNPGRPAFHVWPTRGLALAHHLEPRSSGVPVQVNNKNKSITKFVTRKDKKLLTFVTLIGQAKYVSLSLAPINPNTLDRRALSFTTSSTYAYISLASNGSKGGGGDLRRTREVVRHSHDASASLSNIHTRIARKKN